MLARAALESLLKDRKLDRTLAVFPPVRPAVPAAETVVATGDPRVDQALEGGWPRGHLSSVSGAAGAGRTTLLVGTLARVTQAGELAALIDAADRFDPVPAAARGVVLEQVLWVRGAVPDRRRLPLSGSVPAHRHAPLTQAIRSFDLVLRAGGFGAAVLDLSGVPSRLLRRLPFTTWLRLGRMVEGSRTAAVVIADEPLAHSAGGVSLELQGAPARWHGQSDGSRMFDGPALAPRLRGFKRTGRDLAPAGSR